MVRRGPLVLSLALFVAVACGRSAEVGRQGSEEIGLHLADSGQSVTLHVGDRLNLNLGSSSDRHWVITAFPRSLLSAGAPGGAADFTFTALAPGRGRVVVSTRSRARPRLSMDAPSRSLETVRVARAWCRQGLRSSPSPFVWLDAGCEPSRKGTAW